MGKSDVYHSIRRFLFYGLHPHVLDHSLHAEQLQSDNYSRGLHEKPLRDLFRNDFRPRLQILDVEFCRN